MNKKTVQQELELLRLRGEILRHRINLEGRNTKKSIQTPISYVKSLANPLIRSTLISLGTRFLIGKKMWLTIPTVGLASFLWLRNKDTTTHHNDID